MNNEHRYNTNDCFSNMMYGWADFAIIKKVTINDITEGTTIYERASDWDQWATIEMTGTAGNPIEMNIGNEFELVVNWGTYYQGYMRAYIDRNSDGRWDFQQMGPDQEFIGIIFKTDEMWSIPPTEFVDSKLSFVISDDIQEGPSMLRVIVNYYEYNTDPCFVYY